MNDDFCTKLSQLSINGTVEEIVLRFMEHLKFDLGKDQFSALDCYISFASAVKDIFIRPLADNSTSRICFTKEKESIIYPWSI